jgi:transposase-like protein
MLIVKTLSFKDHLDLTDRLEIALEYLRRGGFYGAVIDLANAYNTNRQRVYDVLDRISEAFHPKPPGPTPKPAEAIEKRNAELEAENASLRARIQELEAKQENSIEVTHQRVRDLSLTLAVLPVSYRDIRDVIALAYGEEYAPSEASICGMVQYYGTIAGLILLDAEVASEFSNACIDEIFFHQTPILTVVDPDSMAVGACERSEDRTGESWHAVLSHFPNLDYIISDQAKGIAKGIYLTGTPETIQHQSDLYHFLIEVSRTTRRLETRLEKLLKAEEKAWQDWVEGRIYVKTMEKTEATVVRQLELMEEYYQALELLDFAFSPMTSDHQVNTREHGHQILSDVIQRLKSLPELGIDDLVKTLEKRAPGCLVFLDQLQRELSSIPVELGEDSQFTAEQIREWAIQEVCLEHAMANDPSDEVFSSYRELWEKVRSLKKLMPVFLKVVSAVRRILYHPKRASSLVECYNSILRPIQQVKKQVTQEFLWLKALHHNMKSFKQGRRKGKSPFQILGVDSGKQDWIQLLDDYQLAA